MLITNEIREHLADLYECDQQTDIETDGDWVYVTTKHGTFPAGVLADIQRDIDNEP